MKSNFKTLISLAAIAVGISLANFCPAAVIVTPPKTVVHPPPVMTPVAFPASYIWDGRQFVGTVGNQVYYLGPGNAWVKMDPARLNHWNSWQRSNPNWRSRATRNTRYRTMAPNKPTPMRGGPPPPPTWR